MGLTFLQVRFEIPKTDGLIISSLVFRAYKDGSKYAQKEDIHNFRIYDENNQQLGTIGQGDDPKNGLIYIDENDIKEVTQDSLRNNISVVSQEPDLFHRSLFDNISYGRSDASFEQVVKAAKIAHAHEFISSLPQGYDTLVGERGIKLSGGQRQRIAIARAILKNAPILVFDEATSSLDSESEHLIQEALEPLMKKRTVVAVAHRLSTIKHFDRILVFSDGKIIEDGSHAELIEIDGNYSSLWKRQSGGFLPENESSSDIDEAQLEYA